MAKLKERIASAVSAVYATNNMMRASSFGEAFFWQEVCSLATAKLKATWAKMQDEEIVPTDDEMRGAGEGDQVLGDDKRFTAVAKVSKPREQFDLDLFISTVARKYKLDPERLREIADASKKETTASLSKRILEK